MTLVVAVVVGVGVGWKKARRRSGQKKRKSDLNYFRFVEVVQCRIIPMLKGFGIQRTDEFGTNQPLKGTWGMVNRNPYQSPTQLGLRGPMAGRIVSNRRVVILLLVAIIALLETCLLFVLLQL